MSNFLMHGGWWLTGVLSTVLFMVNFAQADVGPGWIYAVPELFEHDGKPAIVFSAEPHAMVATRNSKNHWTVQRIAELDAIAWADENLLWPFSVSMSGSGALLVASTWNQPGLQNAFNLGLMESGDAFATSKSLTWIPVAMQPMSPVMCATLADGLVAVAVNPLQEDPSLWVVDRNSGDITKVPCPKNVDEVVALASADGELLVAAVDQVSVTVFGAKAPYTSWRSHAIGRTPEYRSDYGFGWQSIECTLFTYDDNIYFVWPVAAEGNSSRLELLRSQAGSWQLKSNWESTTVLVTASSIFDLQSSILQAKPCLSYGESSERAGQYVNDYFLATATSARPAGQSDWSFCRLGEGLHERSIAEIAGKPGIAYLDRDKRQLVYLESKSSSPLTVGDFRRQVVYRYAHYPPSVSSASERQAMWAGAVVLLVCAGFVLRNRLLGRKKQSTSQ